MLQTSPSNYIAQYPQRFASLLLYFVQSALSPQLRQQAPSASFSSYGVTLILIESGKTLALTLNAISSVCPGAVPKVLPRIQWLMPRQSGALPIHCRIFLCDLPPSRRDQNISKSQLSFWCQFKRWVHDIPADWQVFFVLHVAYRHFSCLLLPSIIRSSHVSARA